MPRTTIAPITGANGANGKHVKEPAAAKKVSVLAPGTHATPDGRIEQSNDQFADAVIEALPVDEIYRGAGGIAVLRGDPGSIELERIEPVDLRAIIDKDIRITTWSRSEKGNVYEQYQPCTKDRASVVYSKLRLSRRIRALKRIVTCPVYIGDYMLTPPGWSDDGTYYDPPPSLRGLKPERDCEVIHRVLPDLVSDFPFKDEASRQNFYGLLLTALLRLAMGGNIPLHLVLAAIERSGKSKLLEQVAGGVILGFPTPAITFSEESAELKKEIVSMLIEGDTLVHFDNLGQFIDSPVLASLLTSTYVKGRLLGLNKTPRLPNTLIITASGNNVRATGEVVKRIAPIWLQPQDDRPEDRTHFDHPDLESYIRTQRPIVLSCLLGMVANWLEAGRPAGSVRMGGFEKWAEVIGGVMHINGFENWMENADEWRRKSDPFSEDLRSLVGYWATELQKEPLKTEAPAQPAQNLFNLAETKGLFADQRIGPTSQAALTKFSKRVLSFVEGRFVLGLQIRQQRSGNNSRYYLDGPKKQFDKLNSPPKRDIKGHTSGHPHETQETLNIWEKSS